MNKLDKWGLEDFLQEDEGKNSNYPNTLSSSFLTTEERAEKVAGMCKKFLNKIDFDERNFKKIDYANTDREHNQNTKSKSKNQSSNSESSKTIIESESIRKTESETSSQEDDYEINTKIFSRSANTASQFNSFKKQGLDDENLVSGNLLQPGNSRQPNFDKGGLDNVNTDWTNLSGDSGVKLMSWQMNSQGILQFANAENTNPNRPNIVKFPMTENMWDRYARLMNMERNIRLVSPHVLIF